ncbi:site-specific integrase [Sinorhizobium prairiense]|uniref:integrase n=1 Tax=unclassified Sinorhizobium TaxID=2613772 RepID=UPI0023D8063E|nr:MULTISPECIES: integrase [unclassified Sinorhizobium]WEJ14212.1 integrase [Sinorhizobium sp. K101]WEJ38173.1 integrase [Sinorhizobium sp. C101]
MAGNLRHWKERNGRYSARIVVPPHLRPYLNGKTELEIQLGGDRRTALRHHAAAVASIQRQIGIAREKHEAATGQKAKQLSFPLTAQQIALRDYQNQIDFDAELRAHDSRYARIEPDPDEARRFRDGFAGKLSDDELQELVGARLERARIAGNTNAIKGTPEWRALAQALCVASYEAMRREDERNEGDFSGQPSHPILANAPPLPEDAPAPVTFDNIIDDEVKRRARGKNAKPLPARTEKKYRDHCAAFAKWRKSKNTLTVTAAEGKGWIESLQDAGELSNRTVKAMLQNVRTVMNWGRQSDPANFFPAGNPLKGIKAPDYTTLPSYLRAFTMDEAKLVLAAARKEEKPMFRWIPWLCAYSGMRVSEAGSLRKEDFFQVGDRWFWKVTTVGNRSLKTASSERRIPVHKTLADEGLLDFVKAAKPGRLFKGDTKDAVLIQPRISTWVRGLIPFDKRPELSPNHGWRHLFEDLCTRDHVPEDARNYMTGRTGGGSQELYGRSEVMLPGLAAAMDRIEAIPI